MTCVNPKCNNLIDNDVLCNSCFKQLEYVTEEYNTKSSGDINHYFMYVDGIGSLSKCECLFSSGFGDTRQSAKTAFFISLFCCKHHHPDEFNQILDNELFKKTRSGRRFYHEPEKKTRSGKHY